MRTIGRHWSKKAPRGDFQAICDYCGVQWRRSQLVRDRAGLLACPDDQRGKDAVTLSQENALAAGEPRGPMMIRDGGNYDNSAQEYLEHPLSILQEGGSRTQLGNSICVGWWQPSQASTLGTGGIRWMPNLARIGGKMQLQQGVGDVYQEDTSKRPTESGDDVVYSSDLLQSNSGVILKSGSAPCFWAVGSFDDGIPSGMFAAEIDATKGLNVRQIATANTVRLEGSYSTSGVVQVNVPNVTDSLHLFSGRMEGSQLVLKIDKVEYTTAATGTLSDDVAVICMGSNFAGANPLRGKLNEVVLSDSRPTDAQITSLERYFKRTYPGLDL